MPPKHLLITIVDLASVANDHHQKINIFSSVLVKVPQDDVSSHVIIVSIFVFISVMDQLEAYLPIVNVFDRCANEFFKFFNPNAEKRSVRSYEELIVARFYKSLQ